MEYCAKCLEGKCISHRWFTDLKLKNEQEILIADLKHILEFAIIDRIVEKIFLVESHLNYTENMYIIDFIHGNLSFTINTPPSAKKDEYYIPLRSYCGKDDIVNYDIEINVDIIRHNPMSIKVMKSMFDATVIHDIQLIYSHDYLHMESIDDYHKIVDLANSRLNIYVEQLQQKMTTLKDTTMN